MAKGSAIQLVLDLCGYYFYIYILYGNTLHKLVYKSSHYFSRLQFQGTQGVLGKSKYGFVLCYV